MTIYALSTGPGVSGGNNKSFWSDLLVIKSLTGGICQKQELQHFEEL